MKTALRLKGKNDRPRNAIGVGRGGRGGGGGGGGRPPNNLRGGANIPFGPPIIHPHFPSVFM